MPPFVKIKIPIPFPLRSVNCYYIEGPLPTLIDSGINTPQARRFLHTALTNLGSGLDRIRRIVITHGHLDHAGMAGWIAARNNAVIYITRTDYPKLTIPHEDNTWEMELRYVRFLETAGVAQETITKIIRRLMVRRRAYVHPIPAVTFIKDQDELDCNEMHLKVLATPGHTPGGICLFDAIGGRLFSGDTLLKHISPNPVIELDNPLFGNGYPSLKHYIKSLDLLEKLNVKTVLPGHGSDFDSHRPRIAQLKEHIQKRKKQVIKILKKLEGPNGALLVQIAARLFPMLQKNQIFLALSESVAHLECLKDEGRVVSQIYNEKIYYRISNRG